jgi:hypothetical protein
MLDSKVHPITEPGLSDRFSADVDPDFARWHDVVNILQQFQTPAGSYECPLGQVMSTFKSYIQLIHISTLYATSSVKGFELHVKQFNETENTVNAYEQSSKTALKLNIHEIVMKYCNKCWVQT